MSGDIDKIRMRPESLFSLEVVVEKLAVPSVVCRFPAVAFRLLDFPTLLVYHVEPDLAETIKKKINADPHYKVPPQLQELKDKSGYFVLKKGKSCLFKVSSEMLQAHLMNTPLYVMLIDTYPKVPKLLGNCSIPLDDVMTRISDDINEHGISTPSSHGERGEFKVYNLMGFEVGDITLGFRLLSLGMGLIPHIPDNVVSVYGGAQPSSQPTPMKMPASKPTVGFGDIDNMEDIVENIVQSIESADKNTQVAVSEFIPHKEHIKTQTEQEKSYFRSSGMQTDIQRKKKTRQRRKDTATMDTFSDVGNELADFFVTNMACPPPLFYNSEADDIQVYQQSLQQGLTFNEDGLMGVQVPQPNYAWGENQTELSSTCSDDTIRHEDVFSDSDVEEAVDFESKRVVYKESRKAVTRKTKIQARKMTDKHIAHQTAQVVQNMNQQTNVKLQQLPLLNALLKEIMALQGGSLPIAQQTTTTTTTTSRSTSAQSKQTPRDRVDREEHLKKLATPRTVAAKHAAAPGSPHKVCAGEPQPVPKNKSWVRKEADTAVPVPKTKLSYGMTNAQRLRLAKTNPALLKKLEKGDQERIEKSRERTRVKYLQYQQEIEIGERLMHSARSVKSHKSLKLDTRASMESTNGQLSEASRSHRRPVPTPRRSLSMKSEQMKEALKKIMEKEYAHGTEAQRSGECEDRDQRHERQVKEIMALQDADDTHDALGPMPEEAQKMDERLNIPTLVDAVPEFGRTKTLYNPGFPSEVPSGRDSHVARPESRLSDYGQYSEDFENGLETSVNGNNDVSEPVLSLRKIVERYSDDSESEKSDAFGDEPSLRKVVEQYSSDEDQGGFETAASHDSNSNQSQSRYTGSHPTSATVMTLNIASMPNPRASIHSPVAAIRPQIPPTREGLAASSTPTESDLGTTQQSTAYIRESQMPTMSDTGGSFDPVGSINEQRESVDFRPRPSPRRKLDRISSVHTDSVSSYAPSDRGLESDSEEGDSENDYTESFDEDSDSRSEPAPIKQMSDLRLAPEARMGYTWGYSA